MEHEGECKGVYTWPEHGYNSVAKEPRLTICGSLSLPAAEGVVLVWAVSKFLTLNSHCGSGAPP